MISKEQITEALNFFGFSHIVDKDEIKKRYRELAKKYHPDSGEYTSPTMFMELIKYKNILDNIHEEPEIPKKEQNEEYSLYKQAKKIENDSIYKYFQSTKNESTVNLEKESNELLELRKKVTEAILIYKELIKKYPKSIWITDAKESIEKLRIWL